MVILLIGEFKKSDLVDRLKLCDVSFTLGLRRKDINFGVTTLTLPLISQVIPDNILEPLFLICKMKIKIFISKAVMKFKDSNICKLLSSVPG